jgi:hypothetical protein
MGNSFVNRASLPDKRPDRDVRATIYMPRGFAVSLSRTVCAVHGKLIGMTVGR